MAESNAYPVLIAADEVDVRGYLEMAMKCLGYNVELAQDGEELMGFLQCARQEFAAVLLDVVLPSKDRIETLREIHQIKPNLPIIPISGLAAPDVVDARRNGATHCLGKPVSLETLKAAMNKALSGAASTPKANGGINNGPKRMYFGVTSRMRELQALLNQIGWADVPVLIQGETGCGKEVIAREIHARSSRGDKAFLKLNCAALPSELVESELFGYERGAFTGAFQKKPGMFELANTGTILLDEIGDMDIKLQAKLLQVLQDQEFHRIGGKDMVRVDVRIIASTHRDLDAAIADRSFREDLYYRLNVINIRVPPLRERKEDLIGLFEFLMDKHISNGTPRPSTTPALEQSLLAHSWPGNIRELENVVRKFIVLRDPELIQRDLQQRRGISGASAAPGSPLPAPVALPSSAPTLEEVIKARQQAEREAILAALDATHWNRRRAAAWLNVEYKGLLYKMKKLGIESKVVRFPAGGHRPEDTEPQTTPVAL